MSDGPPGDLTELSDEALTLRLQRAAFGYFIDYADPGTGLVADTSRPGSPCSISVVGFCLSCLPVAVRNGWTPRSEAAAVTLKILRFLINSVQGDGPDATGYKGFYYHFLDMRTGARVWQCELSVIDTTLLIVGVLMAGVYFDRPDETEIRDLADALYRRVDWAWAQDGYPGVSQGWKPECGFLHYGWEGYNEAALLYVLGLASPTFPLAAEDYATWEMTYQWENMLGRDVLYSGPLFTHLFSHAWIDFRGIRDGFMREKASDYFENTRTAIAIQRIYAEHNPRGFVGYSRDFWGVTAGDGPPVEVVREGGRDRQLYGYMSRGVPYGPDDGTIAPWAMLATLPFDPQAALSGARHLLKVYPQVCSRDRFSSGFNPTLRPDAGGWLSEGWYGLDQGLLVLMIENHRTGAVWEIMRRCAPVREGLKRAGFDGGWLEPAPAGPPVTSAPA
jgi:hypothetical protein